MTRVLARERRGKTQEEMGMMWPQAKERRPPPAAGRGEGVSTLESLRRDLALLTPRFWTSGLQNCVRINFSLFF